MDPDGALQGNLKSNVYKVLKRMMNTDALPNINTIIADGMFFNQITPHCLNWCIFMQKFVSFVVILTQHRTAEYLALKDTEKRKWRIWSCFFHWSKSKNGNRHARFTKAFLI